MYPRSEKDEIRDFLRVLAIHPDRVRVTQIDGPPVIFEIRACSENLTEFASKEIAIQAIARSTGLKPRQFVFKFLEDECSPGP